MRSGFIICGTSAGSIRGSCSITVSRVIITGSTSPICGCSGNSRLPVKCASGGNLHDEWACVLNERNNSLIAGSTCGNGFTAESNVSKKANVGSDGDSFEREYIAVISKFLYVKKYFN